MQVSHNRNADTIIYSTYDIELPVEEEKKQKINLWHRNELHKTRYLPAIIVMN